MMSTESTISAMTAAEYSESVEEWLKQAYQWQIMALGFPSYLAYQFHMMQQQNAGTSQTRQHQQVHGSDFQRPPAAAAAQAQQQHRQRERARVHREYKIPHVWKRFAAEFIDFLALFVVKLVVTFVAVDTFELIDMEQFMAKYDLSMYTITAGEDLDVATAFELTSDIVFLELIHRVVVCIFEAVCTFRGPLGSPGGATPGKLIMGLRIFRCDELIPTGDPHYVQISPGTDLGIFWASIRAVLKSCAVAFMFPVSVTFFFMPFSRTIYDVMSRSIVVEIEPRRRRD